MIIGERAQTCLTVAIIYIVHVVPVGSSAASDDLHFTDLHNFIVLATILF